MSDATRFRLLPMLCGLCFLLSVGSLMIGLLTVYSYEAAGATGTGRHPSELALEAGVFFCPLLVLLQLFMAFYLAVRDFAAAVRWKLLLLVVFASASVLWIDAVFIIGPFLDSWK